MKKLGWLICLILVVVLLFQAGIITPEKAVDWTEKGLTWIIDGLSELLDRLGDSTSHAEGNSSRANTGDDRIDLTYAILVNADHPLPDGYDPGEMVCLYEEERSFQLARADFYLNREAFKAADRMFAAADDAGLDGYIITSAYRDRTAQQKIYDESEPGIAQKPGCSEHETGLAFDVTVRRDSGDFLDTPHCQWLLDHCHEFGFIQRYPEGKEAVTGIRHEPWHYRYVGEDLARRIHEAGCTLEEYLNQ